MGCFSSSLWLRATPLGALLAQLHTVAPIRYKGSDPAGPPPFQCHFASTPF